MDIKRKPVLQLVHLGLARDTGSKVLDLPADVRHARARTIRLCLLGTESAKDPYTRDIIASNARTIATTLQCLEYDYKTKVKPDESQCNAAYSAFVARQSRVARYKPCFRIDDFEELRSAIHTILQRKPTKWVYRCKHGNGQTAEGLIGPDKWLTSVLCPNVQLDVDPLWRLNWIPKDSSRTSEVVAIPKDSRGPRLIAKEPCGSMLLQQGLMSEVVDRMHSVFPIDDQEKHISFMVRRSNEIVTVDLSEASDWLSWNLVNALFPKAWTRILASVRTPFANVSKHGRVRIGSAFTMGAACCFPVLTLICGLLSQLACIRAGLTVTDCSVYGDDIIIHKDAYPYLKFLLSCAGLVENSQKTGVGGRLVESCGCDLLDGSDNVRPFFVREVSTDDLPLYVDSTLALQHEAFSRGFTSTAELLGLYVQCLSQKTGSVCELHQGIAECSSYDDTLAYLSAVLQRRRTRVQWSTDMLTGTVWSNSRDDVKRRFNWKTGYAEHMAISIYEETRDVDLGGAGALASALINCHGTRTPLVESVPAPPRLRQTWQARQRASVHLLKMRIHALWVGGYL